MGLNRAMCTLDSLIIWCYFKLVFFSDVGYLLRRRRVNPVCEKKGDPLVVSSPFPPCLEQFNSSREFQTLLPQWSALCLQWPGCALGAANTVRNSTRSFPSGGETFCPTWQIKSYSHFFLEGNLLIITADTRSSEGLGSIPNSFSKRTWHISITYHILSKKSMSENVHVMNKGIL